MRSANTFGKILAGTLAVPLRHWLATVVFLILGGLLFGFAIYFIGTIGSSGGDQITHLLRNSWIPLAFLPELLKPILIAPLLYVWCRHVATDLPRIELAPHALRGCGKFMFRFFNLWIQFCILFTILHMADRHLIPGDWILVKLAWTFFTLAIAAYVAARFALYLMPGAFVAHRLSWHEAWIGTREIRRPLFAVALFFAAMALAIVMALEQLTVSAAYYGPIIQTAMEWNIIPEIFFSLIDSYIYFAIYWAAGVIWWASIGLTIYRYIRDVHQAETARIFS